MATNPAFSRSRNGDPQTVEVRQDTQKWIVDLLDANSQADNRTRGQLVNEILADWARAEAHKWRLIHRITGGNPGDPDTDGQR